MYRFSPDGRGEFIVFVWKRALYCTELQVSRLPCHSGGNRLRQLYTTSNRIGDLFSQVCPCSMFRMESIYSICYLQHLSSSQVGVRCTIVICIQAVFHL